MKRFVFDNLIYRFSDQQYFLLNLTSFRRQIVSNETLAILLQVEENINQNIQLNDAEQQCYEMLLASKQILNAEVDKCVYDILSSKSLHRFNQFPVRALTFNLTHKCNFNCFYCYQNKYKNNPEFRGQMSISDVKEIIGYINRPEFDASDIKQIVISGGEPLLPGNIDTINYICDNITAESKMMFTNGVNILKYKEHVDYQKIDEFQISLDGTDDVVNEVNCYSGDIALVLHGVAYLLQLKRKVSLVTMWSKPLENHLTEFIDMIKKTGFTHDPNFQMKIIVAKDFYNCSNLDESIYSLEYIKECMSKYNALLRREINCCIELFAEAGLLFSLLHRPLNKVISPRTKRCDISRSIPMVFEPNGDVYWCLCMGNSTGRLGNYLSKEINIEKIKALGNRNIFTIEKCRSCKLKYICGGGCALGLIGRDSDIFEPVCSIFDNTYFWDYLEDFV